MCVPAEIVVEVVRRTGKLSRRGKPTRSKPRLSIVTKRQCGKRQQFVFEEPKYHKQSHTQQAVMDGTV